MQKIFSVREFKAIPIVSLTRFQKLVLRLINVRAQQKYVYTMKLVFGSMPGDCGIRANDIIAVRDMNFAVVKEISGIATVTSLESTEKELNPGWFHGQPVSVTARAYSEQASA
jgi:hypothetical protein